MAITSTPPILDLARLNLPEEPKVQDVLIEEDVDHTGEDSLQVTVVLPNGTPDAHLSGENVIELKFAIREAIRALGDPRFAYISFAEERNLSR